MPKINSKSLFVFQNENGEYYKGNGGRFTKNIKDARFFVSQKTACRHLFVKDYENLKLLEITINVVSEKEVTQQDFIDANNWDFESWKKKKSQL